MNIRSLCRTALVSIFALASLQTPAIAQGESPINLTITGVGVEGYYKVVVESMSSILREAYPGSSITFKPSSPAGGLQMVSDGRADISLAAGSPEIEAAFAGKPPFRTSLKGQFSGLMQVLDGQVFMFIANEEWANKYGIKTLEDIGDKKPPLRVAINRLGNMQIVDVAKDIFLAHGFNVTEIPKWGGNVSWVASGVGLDQLADGKVDMFVNVRFVPDAIISKTASAKNLVWISADKKKLEAVSRKWHYPTTTIPANTYGFLKNDVIAINQWSHAVVGKHVPDEVVRKVLKALSENAQKMQTVHPSMSAFSTKSMAEIMDLKILPTHPIAKAFYQQNSSHASK